jgi:hypothetical protein
MSHELVVALEDKMYPKTYCHHKPNNVQIDETLIKMKVQEL